MNFSRILLSSLILLISCGVLAQNPWTRLSGDPSEAGLNHIQRIPDSDKLIAVGKGSTILISDDIGESWQHIFNPAGFDNYYDIKGSYFIDENKGFIYGIGETILKTNDGGYYWELKYDGEPELAYYSINGLFFVNSLTGFAISRDENLLKTINGGDSWEPLDIGSSVGFSHFEFINSEVGFVYGSTEHIFKTIDSGESWMEMELPEGLPVATIAKLSFINDNIGFIAVGNESIKLFRTEDQGITWTEVYSDWKYSSSDAGDFIFSDDLNGYFSLPTSYGYSLSIIRTEDGGLTWNEEILDGFSWFDGKCICNYNEEINLGVGIFGSVIKSTNAGETWTEVSHRSFKGGILDTQFLSLEDIYILSDLYGGGAAAAFLMKTTDGGLNWEVCNDFYIPSGAISFLNNDIGFIATWDVNLTFYKTIDGGESWTEIQTELEIQPQQLNFIDENNGILTFDYDHLLITSDGGANWESLNLSYGHINDVEYKNLNDIFILCYNGFYYSNDGGIDWDFVDLEKSGDDLYFFNDDTAYIAGYNTILKSTDGGMTWNETNINSEHSIEFKSIYFPSEEIGYAVGEGEYENVYKSTDGGETWNPIESHASSPLNYVYFSNEEEGIITGDLGLIMKTSSGGIVGLEEQEQQVKEKYFELYPNPSSNFVQISLNQVSELANSKLSIIDASGKIIKSYDLKESIAALSISLNNYPKGVYLIQVKSEQGILATEKLIIQ